jgi:hypothetical protein
MRFYWIRNTSCTSSCVDRLRWQIEKATRSGRRSCRRLIFSFQNCVSENESGTTGTGVCCTRCVENYDNILVKLTEMAVPVFIDLRPNGLALEFVVPVGFVVFPDPELDAGVGKLKILMLKEVAVQSG